MVGGLAQDAEFGRSTRGVLANTQYTLRSVCASSPTTNSCRESRGLQGHKTAPLFILIKGYYAGVGRILRRICRSCEEKISGLLRMANGRVATLKRSTPSIS